jgi:serine/threonine protein kinase
MDAVQRIQQYDVIRILGSGGFGTVFEAVDPARPAERVAVKVLHKDLAGVPELAQRFFNEALILAKLEHPAIPRVLSFGPWDGTYVLIQALIEGESMRARIERGPLGAAEATEVLRELLAALGYAHARGVIHRDLKPENLMRGAGGLKVLDFGIAKILGGARLSQAGAFVGSIPYASPEQLRGRDLDARADLFSAGVILHELLTGRVPFQPALHGPPSLTDRVDQQLRCVADADRGELQRACPGVPEVLDRFFRIATAPDPADRFPDAAAALEALAGARAATSGLQVRIAPVWSRTRYATDDDPIAQVLIELEVERPAHLPPPPVSADIFLVLDVSGSMDSPERYPLLRRAVGEFLERMDPDDRIGIAVFSVDAGLITKPITGAQASRDARRILATMDDSPLKFGGATKLAPGLARALGSLREGARGGVRRVYVLTDGELHDTEACARALPEFRAHRIETHVYGFGPAFDAAALRRLVSDQLGGSVKPICNEQDIVQTFSHIAEVNRRLVAEEGMLHVEIDPEVDCGDAWAFRPQERHLGRIRGRRVARELGAVESGRVYSLLLELRLPPGAPGGADTPVARARLSCRTGSTRTEHEEPIVAPRGEGEPVARVEQAFAVLDALRKQDDGAAQLVATLARLELARLEGRDPGLIAALEKQIAVLEGRGSAALDQADEQYLAADYCTGVARS